MAFYENTLVARQDLAENQLNSLKEKYLKIISDTSGKIIKTETWGLLNLANKIKNNKKGYFIHFKFEGTSETLTEIEKKVKIDQQIIRNLIVKYKKLDLKNEYFKKKINEKKK